MSRTSWQQRLSQADPRVNHTVRRATIGTISGLLLLAALFVGGPNGAPTFARVIPWDEQEGYPALLSTEAGPAATSTPAGLDGLAAMLKPPATPTPGPRLDPLPQWVQSLRTITLWSRPGDQGAPVVSLAEKVQLRVLGQVENGRLPVYYDDGKPNGQRLGAWVNPGDVSPFDGVDRVVASSRGGPRPTPDISTPEKFIAAVAEAAQESQRATKVLASVTIAQAILESDWGRSLLSKKAQNYFGIKATRAPGPAGVINMNTWEVLGGQNVTVSDGFKAYHNLWESVADHGHFLADNSRYAAAFKVLSDAQEFARRIHAAGYATDPAYSTKLINFMNKYNLYQYDLVIP